MKDKNFQELAQFVKVYPNIVPVNRQAYDLLDLKGEGEMLYMKEIAKRDLKFHRCYFALLNYIYSYLPDVFRNSVSEDKFYIWLKHLKKEYKVLFKFQDGTKLVEYDSISFGRMNQTQFEDYIRNQLPFIYENVIHPLYSNDKHKMVIDNIEDEFKKFLSKI